MTAISTHRKNASLAVTEGIRITASPKLDTEQSDINSKTWVFRYAISIVNESQTPVTLLRRRWLIVDASGARHEVKGDGVIGQTPRLEPGGKFGYESYCPMKTPWGTMEGFYTFRREPGDEFEAAVARFYLVSESSVVPSLIP